MCIPLMQGHFQIVYSREHYPLLEKKLPWHMRLLYCSAVYSYIVCCVATPYFQSLFCPSDIPLLNLQAPFHNIQTSGTAGRLLYSSCQMRGWDCRNESSKLACRIHLCDALHLRCTAQKECVDREFFLPCSDSCHNNMARHLPPDYQQWVGSGPHNTWCGD